METGFDQFPEGRREEALPSNTEGWEMQVKNVRAIPKGSGVAVADAAPAFVALGDETRLRLLVRLSSGGPESISRLSESFAVSRQAVTKHLGVLEHAGLVRGMR